MKQKETGFSIPEMVYLTLSYTYERKGETGDPDEERRSYTTQQHHLNRIVREKISQDYQNHRWRGWDDTPEIAAC